MRIPRDVSGGELVKALKVLGYVQTRQTGSHIRLTTSENGTHHITVPYHQPLRIGTLASILDDIAAHHKMSRSELLLLLDL
ncbi:MAG: type II toxin-antitoxin system HicA family toxin [Chloracidobacterium sp.]|nr:type II toxin-antitoxin system HicA family toxin [Chloracidobacterium sp.]